MSEFFGEFYDRFRGEAEVGWLVIRVALSKALI